MLKLPSSELRINKTTKRGIPYLVKTLIPNSVKHKYKFDPSSKKFVCPKCGKKRFVRMVCESGNYLSDDFGRCDRSNSCGYSMYPQGNEQEQQIDYSLPKVKVSTIKNEVASTLPILHVQQSMKRYEINSFFQFLLTIFSKEEIDVVFNLYKVGTSKKWGGSAVFWQINIDFEVRSGKVIKFDIVSGKRIKEPFTHTTWVHSLLKLTDFNLKQVLYGEHLLNQFPEKVICIVESEKTAVIMALKHPIYLWLATSGKNGFTIDKLRVLKKRHVVIFPDSDAFNEWNEKAKLISKQINLNLHVSPFVMNCTIAMEQTTGFDLADLIQININKLELMQVNTVVQDSALDKLKQRNPYVSELIRVFDLYEM